SNTFSQLYPGYGVGGSSSMVGDQNDDMGDNLETFSLGGDFLQVALSRHDICVLMDSVPREIKCWGYLHSWPRDNAFNTYGHYAVFIPSTTAVVDKLFIGDNHPGGWGHACALLQDATVKCWGDNASGQLGLGDTTDRSVVNGDVLPDLQLLAP
ncbi:MAG: RCC1 domain-containing protein, partial [Myxococcota bacterium]|nr:RCC1 domain-containing protein [Myxococcota bacterium]